MTSATVPNWVMLIAQRHRLAVLRAARGCAGVASTTTGPPATATAGASTWTFWFGPMLAASAPGASRSRGVCGLQPQHDVRPPGQVVDEGERDLAGLAAEREAARAGRGPGAQVDQVATARGRT